MGRHVEIPAVMQVKDVAKQPKCSLAVVCYFCALRKVIRLRFGIGRGMLRGDSLIQVVLRMAVRA